jgi:hypothetical protein
LDAADMHDSYPALLLPYRDKDEFTMPKSHYFALTGYMGNVENLIIIGWKGNEAAFNKLLGIHATGIKKIVIVDPYPAVVKANIQGILKNDVTVKYYNTFEDFIQTGLESEIA